MCEILECEGCGHFPARNLGTHTLCYTCEFNAAARWRLDNPEMSVFACDGEMKRRYRDLIVYRKGKL